VELLEHGVNLHDELSLLEAHVPLHGVVVLQGVPQVLHLINPRQVITVQFKF